jgi:RHS repeat-associated protein
MGCLKLTYERDFCLSLAGDHKQTLGRRKKRAGTYKYKFQGQERQDELGLNWDSFKWRNYDMAIGRFMSIDPLTEKYMDWTPYAFSGNRVVDSRELEGLEPVASRTGTKNLIIVNQGYGGNPAAGATQAQNAGKTNSNIGVDYSGLGKISSLDNARNGTQVAVFASSEGNQTKDDIVSSINSFKSENKDGNVILVGHSLGADNMIEMVNENPSIKVDFMLTIDTADDYDDDNIPSNVKSIVNYYVKNDGVFGSSIGGEKIEVNDPSKTKGINVPVNSTHTKIDNDYIQNFMNRINSFLNQQSDEKKK